jgi:iron complex outermembrane recepter protein
MLEAFQRRIHPRVNPHTSMLARVCCALAFFTAISLTANAQDQTQANAQGQTQPPQQSNASTATAPGEEATSGELQNVTVTARYQKENLQQTPLAITELSGADLQANSIIDTADLGAVVPNLYTHPGDQEEGTTPTISMRGVTAGDYSFESTPAVGIYVDGVYHSTMVGANLDLADVDNIQVNRGPQGTLAGNSSIAGSIYINSKVPTGSDTGYFTAGYGAFNELEAMGSYDTTIAPNLFM